jgi:vacuolar iron transporter family protein
VQLPPERRTGAAVRVAGCGPRHTAQRAFGGLGLFLLGAVAALFTGGSALRSGLRQMLLDLAAGAITYGLGALLGVTLS